MCLSVCEIQYSTQPHTHTRTHARSHSFWRTLALFAALVQSVIVAAAHSRAATQLPTYWRLSMYMCVLLFIRVGVCVHGCPSMHSVTCVLQRVCASKQCKKVLSAKTLFACIYIYIYIYVLVYSPNDTSERSDDSLKVLLLHFHFYFSCRHWPCWRSASLLLLCWIRFFFSDREKENIY